MPINDDYRVVFVHIPKNGGTTIEYLLGMHGNLKTVGIVPYENQVQNEFLFGAGSQEFTAEKIKETIGKKKYSDYTSFCISRNPYSRMVSYISWLRQFRPHVTKSVLSIEEFNIELSNLYQKFLKYGFSELYLKPQWHYVYNDNKELLVDEVFLFEEYYKIYSFISSVTSSPVNSTVKRMPSNHYPYQKYLNKDSIDIINKMYNEDFTLFNYQML